MAISIKTPEEIEKMRVAGRLAAEVLEMIEPFVKPGVSTGELDRICNDYIVNEQHARTKSVLINTWVFVAKRPKQDIIHMNRKE